MLSRAVTIDVPLDLRKTLRPLHGRFAPDGWWLPARTPEGPASLRISRTRHRLVGDAWGPGADWMLTRLAGIAGLDDEPSEFETDHPVVSRCHRRNPGLRFGKTGLVFDALVAAICAQKVTGKEARDASLGLRRVFSRPAPGPLRDLRLPPDPAAIAIAPYWEFHRLQLERRRAETLRRVAADAGEIERLAEAPAAEAASSLEAFTGVGEWTVAETLAVSHGHADAVPVGDFHIKHIVVHHLTGKDRGTDREMLELLEQFRPHRGRVVRLLHTLGHAPRFGPKMTPRDITRM